MSPTGYGPAKPGLRLRSRCSLRASLAFAALLFLAACPAKNETTTPTPAKGSGKTIAIFATGDIGGDTEQCGCKARPMGGVARRAKSMKDRAAKYAGATFVADAGDLLVKSPILAPREVEQARETAAFLAKSMRMMDSAPVLAVGERDLALGLGTLRRVAEANELTLVSANLVHAKTGTAAFPAYKIVEHAGVKIGFVGASFELDPKSIAWTEVYSRNGLEPKPADLPVAEAARKARSEGAELVVGLFHLGSVRAKELLNKMEPGLIDFAIVAHDRLAGNGLEPVNGSGILTSGERGKWMLAVEVELTPGAKGVRDVGAVDNAKKQLEELDARIADYKKPDPNAANADPATKEKLAKDREATIVRLEKRRVQVERDLGQVSTEPRHLLRSELVPLDIALPEDSEMLAAVNAYKDRLAIVNAKTGAPVVDQKTLHYVGTNVCKTCHPGAYQQWLTTKHAKAWATMERTRQTANLDCIGCHTTGFDRPGGPNGLQNLTQFFAVGCESCHGAGSLHVAQPKEIHTTIASEATCAECHRVAADQKPFVYAERLPRIFGPGHGPGKVHPK